MSFIQIGSFVYLILTFEQNSLVINTAILAIKDDAAANLIPTFEPSLALIRTQPSVKPIPRRRVLLQTERPFV